MVEPGREEITHLEKRWGGGEGRSQACFIDRSSLSLFQGQVSCDPRLATRLYFLKVQPPLSAITLETS